MYTVERLLDIAIEAAAAKAAARAAPVWNYGAWHAADMREIAAMVCAEWMDEHGVTEAAVVGPFGEERSLARGDRARIKPGSKIHSTSKRLARMSGRAFVVTVHDFHEGWAGRGHRGNEVRHPTVHWVGSGGYWCWTDSQNVETVATPAAVELMAA